VDEAGWSAQVLSGMWGDVPHDGRVGSAAVATPTHLVQRRAYHHSTDSTGLELAELHGSVALLARSMSSEFGPGRFVEDVSAQVQRFISHDRLIIAYLDEGGRSFSVLDEHAGSGPFRHEGHYTSTGDLGRRYTCDDIANLPGAVGCLARVQTAKTGS
jgi:hypothetical protein